jgi:hypothetical protein
MNLPEPAARTIYAVFEVVDGPPAVIDQGHGYYIAHDDLKLRGVALGERVALLRTRMGDLLHEQANLRAQSLPGGFVVPVATGGQWPTTAQCEEAAVAFHLKSVADADAAEFTPTP